MPSELRSDASAEMHADASNLTQALAAMSAASVAASAQQEEYFGQREYDNEVVSISASLESY